MNFKQMDKTMAIDFATALVSAKCGSNYACDDVSVLLFSATYD